MRLCLKLKENTKFPKVKGADDAKRAKWIALSDIRRDQCFEDHAAIIETFMDYNFDGHRNRASSTKQNGEIK